MHLWKAINVVNNNAPSLSTRSPGEYGSLSRSWYQKLLSGTTFLLRASIAEVQWKDKRGGFTDTNVWFFKQAHQLLCGL